MFKRAGIVTISDLNKPRVQSGMEAIAGEFASTTVAAYRATLGQFLEWAADGGSIPAAFRVGKVKVANDTKRVRRPLSVQEQEWLVRVAEQVGKAFTGASWAVTGRDRAMIYRVALAVGARASECMSLEVGNLQLASSTGARVGDKAGPGITLNRKVAKSREAARIPIQPSLAALLREYVKGKPAGARVFPACPTEDLASWLRDDMEQARQQWLEEVERTAPGTLEDQTRSDFLRSHDSQGRDVDFHALRHTFVQNLVDSGVDVNTVQALARHADVSTTLGYYTKTSEAKKSEAVAKLPDLSTPPPARLPVAAELAA